MFAALVHKTTARVFIVPRVEVCRKVASRFLHACPKCIILWFCCTPHCTCSGVMDVIWWLVDQVLILG